MKGSAWARSVDCDFCAAAAGDHCTTESGRKKDDVHWPRYKEARRQRRYAHRVLSGNYGVERDV